MKKLLVLACLLVSMVTLSKAQGGRPRMSPADQSKQMQAQLKLTDDQTSKIMAILQTQTTKMDSVRAAGGDRTAMMPIRQAATAKIDAVLTPDQKAAYKKMQDDMRAKYQQGGGMGGGGTPPPPQK